jgi:hypothetical protein
MHMQARDEQMVVTKRMNGGALGKLKRPGGNQSQAKQFF